MVSRSFFGAVLAALHIAVAIFAVASDRSSLGGAGWGTLEGMGAAIVTLPLTALGEALRRKPDCRRNLDIAFAIGARALLVCLAGAGLARVARTRFAAG